MQMDDHARTLKHGYAINNNEKFRSFKSKENNHKKEVGPYRGSAIKASLVTL